MMFTIFDIIIFTIIVVSTIGGSYKGLVGIAVNLLGFVVSIVTSIFLFSYIKLHLAEYIENALVLSVFSAVLFYICFLFILTYVTSRTNSLLSTIRCGFFDRFLGTIVGFLRGLLISVIIFSIIAVVSSKAYLRAQNFKELVFNIDTKEYPTWLADSKTTSFLEILLDRLNFSFLVGLLESIKLPEADKDEEQDIIDAIKNRKGQDVIPPIGAPIVEDAN